MVQNDKKFFLSRSISQEPHIIYDFHLWYTCVKWYCLHAFFHFFKILIFWVIRGVKREKGVLMTKNSVCHTPCLRNHTSRFLSKYFCLQLFFLIIWVSLLFAKSVSCKVLPYWSPRGKFLKFGSPDCWELYFWHTFWLQRTRCPYLINNIFPVNIMVWW